MEIPDNIRTSLHKGELVMSIDFKDADFHIPIYPKSRKYLRFHRVDPAHLDALLLGLSTAPVELKIVVKEVKLMAQNKGIRIHST